MWSVLYINYADGDAAIVQVGPAPSEPAALKLARDAWHRREFNINDQRVYMMRPDGHMHELSFDDLASAS
jgi:hypothetical protein